MESKKAILEFEDVVFRGKMPRKKVHQQARKIEVEHLDGEGLADLTVQRDLVKNNVINICWSPF